MRLVRVSFKEARMKRVPPRAIQEMRTHFNDAPLRSANGATKGKDEKERRAAESHLKSNLHHTMDTVTKCIERVQANNAEGDWP